MTPFPVHRYLPLDKSWTLRLGCLDIIRGDETDLERLVVTLSNCPSRLSDDLAALLRCAKELQKDGTVLDVEECATLFRFLQFHSWKAKKNWTFLKNGSLLTRKVSADPHIVRLPTKKLLLLDGGTSQWASAAFLSGRRERIPRPRPKLKLTYEAIDHWEASRARGAPWETRLDRTIGLQAQAYVKAQTYLDVQFKPRTSEDFCFAMVFNRLPKNWESKWSSVRNHESDRPREILKSLGEYNARKPVSSKDHRVVQAVAMRTALDGMMAKFKHPGCVSKSWPLFWDFMVDVELWRTG